jgi:hypothetical protein
MDHSKDERLERIENLLMQLVQDQEASKLHGALSELESESGTSLSVDVPERNTHAPIIALLKEGIVGTWPAFE